MSKEALPALGYVRVSTEEQSREGVSLPAQEEQIRRYCDLYGLELGEILRDEGQSGKDMDRPAMQELLGRVGRGEVGAVVVYKLDRAARSTIDSLTFAETLKGAGAAFHSVTERIDTTSAHGGFFFTLLAALAEMERRLIVERTASALAYKKERGEWVGRPPVGYRMDGGKLAADSDAQAAIAKAKRMRRQGKSYRAIAERLSLPLGTVHLLVKRNGKTRKAQYSKAQ